MYDNTHSSNTICYQMPTKPSLFGFTLERLSLGTFNKVVTCQSTASLAEVLKVLNKSHFASVPIVNHEGTSPIN